jgi:cell division protein FtsL
MRKNTFKQRRPAALVRVRFMAVVLAVITLSIAGPLALVWKQAYIASASIRIEAMNDTVSALNRKIATLQLLRDRLSSNERIERVARTRLGLEYPSSDRIVIIPISGTEQKHGLAAGVGDLMAIVQGQSAKGGTE